MTKRCKNCGWPNDDNTLKCEKCGAALESVSSPSYQSQENSYQQTVSESAVENDRLRKTVSENQFFGKEDPINEQVSPKNKEVHCPNCGYPAREGATICMNCGTPLSGSSHIDAHVNFVPNSHAGTVNPWMKPENNNFCTLKPIAWAGENVVYQPQSYSGESVILNRANTDPNNQSITSKEQAELVFEDGEWFIVDKSVQHTTYVLASQKIKLHKGDIIVLGNRLFEFN